RMSVPESSPVAFCHAQFDGSDFTLQDTDYSGPGAIGINCQPSGPTRSRIMIDGIRRAGGTASSSAFLSLSSSQDCIVTHVADYRDTTAASIRVHSGEVRHGHKYAYVIDTVWSLTSNSNVVEDTQGLAKQINVQRF